MGGGGGEGLGVVTPLGLDVSAVFVRCCEFSSSFSSCAYRMAPEIHDYLLSLHPFLVSSLSGRL